MFTAWKPSNATNQSSYLLVVSSSTRAGLPAHNYYLRINLLAGIDGPHDNLHMVKHYTNTRFLKSLFPAIYNSEMRAMSVAKVKTFLPIALHFLQTPWVQLSPFFFFIFFISHMPKHLPQTVKEPQVMGTPFTTFRSVFFTPRAQSWALAASSQALPNFNLISEEDKIFKSNLSIRRLKNWRLPGACHSVCSSIIIF